MSGRVFFFDLLFLLRMDRKRFLLIFGICFVTVMSCKKGGSAKLQPVCDGSNTTYVANIKVIIEGNCNSNNCHNTGSVNGDFTSYNGLAGLIANGKFRKQVLTDQVMPKGPNRLSQNNIDMIQCWVNDGYPEN